VISDPIEGPEAVETFSEKVNEGQVLKVKIRTLATLRCRLHCCPRLENRKTWGTPILSSEQ